MIFKPEIGEYNPYFKRYIDLVADGDIIEILTRRGKEFAAFMEKLSQSEFNYRYAENKWRMNEVIGHMIDTEIIFTYRALRFARGDQTELPGFDQDDYAAVAGYDSFKKEKLIELFNATRNLTVSLFYSFDEEMYKRSGIADGHKMAIRAIPFIIAGHQIHHEKIIRERYLHDA